MPGEWAEKPLGELVTLEYGAGLPQAVRTGEGYPVYGSNGLLGRHSEYLIQGPGIVVGRKGTVGAVAWSDESFWPIDTTYYVQPRGDTDLRWIYWRLSALPLSRLDSSTGVPGLNRHDAYALKVLVPPLAEQHRIAEMLDAADEAIRQMERVIAKLKAVKAGLLHDLLTRGLDEHDHLRDPQAHPEQFKDSPLGRIPRRWELAILGSVIVRSGGLVQTGPFGSQLHAEEYTTEGIPVIMPQDIQDSRVVEDQIAHIPSRKATVLARHRVIPNDVVFARRGDLSRCAFIGQRETGWLCGTGCLLVRPPEKVIDGYWLSATYQHSRSQRQIAARAVGSTMVNLNTSLLASLMIAKPPYDEQVAIIKTLNAYDSCMHAEEAELAKLRQVKHGLMDDLLTGRVRVSP